MLPPYSFAHICHRLGIAHRNRAWQVKHVRHIIQNGDFPEPLPLRIWRTVNMVWDRRAIDHWFDQRAGMAATAAARQSETRAAAVLLDQRADHLSGARP